MARRKRDIHPSTGNANGEISVLNIDKATGASSQAVDAESRSDDGALSLLKRLEGDIRDLQEKLLGVEAELRSRDSRINALLGELDARDARIGGLVSNLAEAHEDRDRADHALMAADRRIKELDKKLEHSEQKFQQLRAEIGKNKKASTRFTEREEEMESRNAELSSKVQDLELYIDGRQREWSELEKQLENYENAFAGMEQDIRARDNAAEVLEKDKADLALRILELERRCANLDGRRAEREDDNETLRKSLDKRSQEVERLKSESSHLSDELAKINRRFQKSQDRIESLSDELVKRDEQIVEFEHQKSGELRPADAGKAEHTAEHSSPRLRELEERIRGYESNLASSKAHIQTLSEQLIAGDTEICELRNRLDQVSASRDQAEEELLQIRAHDIDSAAMLDSNRGEIERLEAELEAQRELIDILEQQQPPATGDGSDIIDLGDPEPDFDLSRESINEIFTPNRLATVPISAQRMIVARDTQNGERERYPLTQPETTIGRAPSSDIRISEKYISRLHARIVVDKSTVIIEDMGSTNGFLVNSEETTRHELQHGDRLKIGTREFEYIDSSS